MEKDNYTLGFIFHPSLERVLLIKKFKKPKHHIGKWNGVGGKIDDESPMACMLRETQEECGIPLDEVSFEYFALLNGSRYTVKCYRGKSLLVNRGYEHETPEGLVRSFNVDSLYGLPIVCNVNWLVQMALDHDVERKCVAIDYA